MPGLFQSFDEQTMDTIELIVFLLIYLVTARDIVVNAIKNILKGRALDEQFLMSIASLGAFFVGEYPEACAVMLFYMVGELFQDYAVDRSRDSITELMDIRPDYANLLKKDGTIERVDPNKVKVGDIIVVKPGEKIPLDGTIIEGQGSLDTSSLTGESLPREVLVADSVISGSISVSGALTIKVTKAFGESTVSKILELVENASSRKSKSEEFIAKFARVYTPAVCYSALALAVLPPLVRLLMLGTTPDWSVWIYRALTFLVISCPCALVISIPLSFFAGIGGASNQGVLIKGSNFMETLSQVKTVVFDKTGTLTKGVFEVSGIHHNQMEDAKLIEYAALAECASSHPISRSLQNAYGKEIDRNRVTDIEEISGYGVIAKIDGVSVAAGNSKLMNRLGITYQDCHSVGTIIHMAVDGNYAGHIVISDIEKPTSQKAIASLKKAGITKTVMLTGDAKKVADKVAADLGVDEVRSELLPADKVAEVEKLLKNKGDKDKLAFVGDGINDAPVLTRADIGIAMGAMGSDAAIEAADVVLMDDDPLKIAKAIRISRKCIRIVYENIVFALVIKFGCLVLGALGIANMGAAIFADVGVMILAVLNAIRALQVKNL
ncbi:MAG: heavy metal translocating P-type ATPase [Pararoseburia sp.]|nr:heavy metal translocating P-type ATPase [Pararoseburia sp.]